MNLADWKSAAQANRRRLYHLAAAYRVGAIPLAQLTTHLRGWINHVRFANTVGLRKAVLRVNLQRRAR